MDLGNDGFSPFRFKENDGRDTDGDGVLDENELTPVQEGGDVDGSDVIADLVLQTTFDEWENYMAARDSPRLACSECHMPAAQGQLVDDAPGAFGLSTRTVHSHGFIGVDYDLTPGHYARLGLGGSDGLEEVLAAREQLLRQAARFDVKILDVGQDTLTARVSIGSASVGHDLPTGFAFARQMWVEVSARTADGQNVCLVEVEGIPSPCRSGRLESTSEDLRVCDPREVAQRSGSPLNESVKLLNPAPVGRPGGPARCDPWLTNYQKILTDGDPDRDGTFEEVAYQSLQADIVKLGVRAADQQVMAPLQAFEVREKDGREARDTFDYAFDASTLAGGDQVTVTAVLHFRHLPPYFLRALDGFYPDGLTADVLLGNMRVAQMARARAKVTVL